MPLEYKNRILEAQNKKQAWSYHRIWRLKMGDLKDS